MNGTVPRLKTCIRGIERDARALGCTRQHLRSVIAGRRSSPELFARFQRLQDSRREEQTTPRQTTESTITPASR